MCVYVSIPCSQKAEEKTDNSRPERQKEQLARRGQAATEGEAWHCQPRADATPRLARRGRHRDAWRLGLERGPAPST